MNESVLRDLIAQKICQLKSGLTLLRKEQYIPNSHGTRSFIDLYARDEAGRHVLIELKRSTDASRDALHEVVKYAEGVKQYFGAKNSEIHVIIASTEWDELMVPFSRFSADAGFSVEGLRIHLLHGGSDFRTEPVIPLPVTQGRLIAPWHNVYWYANEDRLKKGLRQIEAAYQQKGIEDYVIVLFQVSNPPSQEELLSALRTSTARRLNVPEEALATLPKSVPPVDKYAAYTAVQTLSREACLKLIARDPEQYAEAQALLPELEGQEALCYLHRCVEALAPFPGSNYYEIGNPAKFNLFYRSGDFLLLEIIRSGIFLRNRVLSDQTLCAELGGEDGASGQKLKCRVNMSNSAQVRDLRRAISDTLAGNPVWRGHMLRIVDEIGAEFSDSELEVSVFNPETGILTLYFVLSREQGALYLPYYHMIVRRPDDVRMYYGSLASAGTAQTFPELLWKYYDGSLDALLYTLTWGGRDTRDSDIIEDLGAQYRSYRFDIRNAHAAGFSVLRDEKWRPCKEISMFELFQQYAESNGPLIGEILSAISPYDNGASFSLSGRTIAPVSDPGGTRE